MFDYSSSIREHTIACDRDRFETVIQSTKVQTVCKQIADWHAKKERGECSQKDFDKIKSELKKRLPVFLFHAHFKNGHRINSMAEPSGLCIFDIDHISSIQNSKSKIQNYDYTIGEILREHVFSHEPITDDETIKRLKALGIVLVHLTPSCEGLRLVFRIPDFIYDVDASKRAPGAELAVAQKWLATELGEKEYDTSVKDYARCSFAVPSKYILYIDNEALFCPLQASPKGRVSDHLTPTVGAANSDSPKGSTMNFDSPGMAGGSETAAPTSPTNAGNIKAAPTGLGNQKPPLGGGLVGTSDTNSLQIFKECIKAANLTIADLSSMGIRHNSLVTLLSNGICQLLQKPQLEACLQNASPEYFQESDCRQLIDDWYAKYNDPNRPMSRRLQRIFTDSIKSKCDTQDNADTPTPSVIPVLNVETMPRALRASLISTPENLRLPVLISLLPLMAVYADGVEFDYLDNETTRLNMMSFVIGPQASGKSSCTRMQRIWMKPLLEMDEASRRAEDEWKEKDRTMGANEERPPRPHTPIRVCAATISNRMFHTRLVNAKPHAVYMFCPELDTMVNSNNAGAWSNLYDKMRMSDDNDLWNMDYSNSDSLSELVPVRCNYSMLGTYGAFRRCFKDDNVENGLATRVLIAEMPDNSFQPLVPYKKVSAEQIKAINEGIVTLSNAKGHFECPRLRELIADWAEEKMAEAIELSDCVIDTFRRRTARIGMRIGVIMELLEGKESDRILTLTRQLTDYVMSEQIRIFGNQIKKIHEENAVPYYKVNNKDLLEKLPHEFSYDDVVSLRSNASENSIRITICRWLKRGIITKIEKGKWKKIKKLK